MTGRAPASLEMTPQGKWKASPSFQEKRARPRLTEARWRSPLQARHEYGIVNPRDVRVTGELSRHWGISRDYVCAAARELGEEATAEAVHARAVALRSAEGYTGA
jgi:hypothetical protein